MTFNEAYKVAMEKSDTFRNFDERVKKAMTERTDSGCLIFAVEPGQTFFYGFDGVDVHKGKHTSKRSEHLIERSQALIIL